MNIGRAVRAEREKRGVSQVALACRLGISRSRMSIIEDSRNSVQMRTVIRIAEVLEMRVRDLLEEAERYD